MQTGLPDKQQLQRLFHFITYIETVNCSHFCLTVWVRYALTGFNIPLYYYLLLMLDKTVMCDCVTLLLAGRC